MGSGIHLRLLALRPRPTIRRYRARVVGRRDLRNAWAQKLGTGRAVTVAGSHEVIPDLPVRCLTDRREREHTEEDE